MSARRAIDPAGLRRFADQLAAAAVTLRRDVALCLHVDGPSCTVDRLRFLAEWAEAMPRRLQLSAWFGERFSDGLASLASGGVSHVLRLERPRPGQAGDGAIIEVFGDLRRARHIAVVVPGMDNDLTNYPDKLRPGAEALAGASRAMAARADDVAVVAWLGYDPPDALPSLEVLRRGQAEAGAAELIDFVRDVRLLSPESTVTVVAHSYGTVLVGAAVRHGLDAERIVALGSPGMGFDQRVEELHAKPATKFFSLAAPADAITFTEYYGRDPNDDGSGFQRLATGAGVLGHSQYFAVGSESLANIARVVVGRDSELRVRGRNLAERIERPVDAVRDDAKALHRDVDAWVDGQQRSWRSLPWVGPVAAVGVNPLVDIGQHSIDRAHAVLDDSVEHVEDVVDAGGSLLHGALKAVGL